MTSNSPNPAWPLPSEGENAAGVGKLRLMIREQGLTEAKQSLLSLQQAVASGLLADASVEGINRLFDLAAVDLGHLATFSADNLTLLLEPTEQYLGCVAAIAARDGERHVICIEYRHGWPILSVVSPEATVAEGAAPANAAPEAEACSLLVTSRLSRATPRRLSR